jgi:hypothetical protein
LIKKEEIFKAVDIIYEQTPKRKEKFIQEEEARW